MSETDAALIGIRACGCITYVNTEPFHLDQFDEKAIANVIRQGGHVVTTTVGEARARPHFLPSECPHNPEGWVRS